MTRQKLSILAFVLLTFQSCDFYQMFKELDNLEYLSEEMDAEKCKISFVKEKNNLSGDTIQFSFIELNFINSKAFKNPNVDKISLTSYCAIKTYELLDSKIWNGKEGINIIFDGKNELPNDKLYYFKLLELKDISKIISNSNNLLTTFEKAIKNFENFNLYHMSGKGATLGTNDSLEIANYFSNDLFKENKDLVTIAFREFRNIKELENSSKKYNYEKVTIADTIDSKIVKSDYYKVNLSLVQPDNEVHYIKYYIKSDNLMKFVAIEM